MVVHQPVFLIDENEEIIELSSEQGSRQGCPTDCLGFCLSLVKASVRKIKKFSKELVARQRHNPKIYLTTLQKEVIPKIL